MATCQEPQPNRKLADPNGKGPGKGRLGLCEPPSHGLASGRLPSSCPALLSLSEARWPPVGTVGRERVCAEAEPKGVQPQHRKASIAPPSGKPNQNYSPSKNYCRLSQEIPHPSPWEQNLS